MSEYLGDGVYVDHREEDIILSLEDCEPEDFIALSPILIHSLFQWYLQQLGSPEIGSVLDLGGPGGIRVEGRGQSFSINSSEDDGALYMYGSTMGAFVAWWLNEAA